MYTDKTEMIQMQKKLEMTKQKYVKIQKNKLIDMYCSWQIYRPHESELYNQMINTKYGLIIEDEKTKN